MDALFIADSQTCFADRVNDNPRKSFTDDNYNYNDSDNYNNYNYTYNNYNESNDFLRSSFTNVRSSLVN